MANEMQAGMICGCTHALSVAWQTKHFMDGDCCHPVARQIHAAENGYCYTCGILSAPKFYYDAGKCRAAGHDVRSVGR